MMHIVLVACSEALSIATLKKNIFYSILDFLSSCLSLLPSSLSTSLLSLSPTATLLSLLSRCLQLSLSSSLFTKEFSMDEALVWRQCSGDFLWAWRQIDGGVIWSSGGVICCVSLLLSLHQIQYFWCFCWWCGGEIWQFQWCYGGNLVVLVAVKFGFLLLLQIDFSGFMIYILCES